MTSQTKSSFNKVFANQPNIFGNLGEMEEGLKQREGVGSIASKNGWRAVGLFGLSGTVGVVWHESEFNFGRHLYKNTASPRNLD